MDANNEIIHRNIGIFISARSEYGLLRWIIRELVTNRTYNLKVFAGGGLTASSYGYSVEEIYRDFDGLEIVEMPYSMDGDTPNHITKSISLGLGSFAQSLFGSDIDLLLVIGDRYDLFIPTIAATLGRIPVVHLCGGDITNGAIDNNIRYAVSKLSHIHLVQTSLGARNVSKAGEEDWRIAVIGAPGVENIYRLQFPSKQEIRERLLIDLDRPTALCTYHPVTLEFGISAEQQIKNLFSVLDRFNDIQYVLTYPGIEDGSSMIIQLLHDFCESRKNVFLFKTLGSDYLSIMKHSVMVIGNSSSGIIEAPSFHIPTVNVGTRQDGRERALSIIDCDYDETSIEMAIQKALSEEFREKVALCLNPFDPYSDGNTSARLMRVLKNMPETERLLQKKMDFEVNENEWNWLLR